MMANQKKLQKIIKKGAPQKLKDDQIATIKDVAVAAGVSPSTVSRALNNSPHISNATRAKVLAVAQELGYAPNTLARGLVSDHVNVIGVLTLDIDNPFFSPLISGIENVAESRDFSTLIGESQRRIDLEERHIRRLRQMRVAGVVLTPTLHRVDHLITLRDQGIPVVIVARRYEDMDFVTQDDTACGHLAAEHFISLGHRNCVCIVRDEPSNISDRLKLEGFRRTLEANGISFSENGVISISTQELSEGARIADELLQWKERPTAVFCSTDNIAIGLLPRLLDLGVRIPDDIAIIGCNDILYSRFLPVPLTTVRIPKYEMGKLAATMLCNKIEYDQEPRRIENVFLTPELIIRNSTVPGMQPLYWDEGDNELT